MFDVLKSLNYLELLSISWPGICSLILSWEETFENLGSS